MEDKKRNIAYLRVSTSEQDIDKNKAEILKLANNRNLGQVEFVSEKISGRVNWDKRKFGKVFNQLKKGDSIILHEMSRLGRSMLECIEIISIGTKRGINFYSVKGNWHFDGTLQSKILTMVFSLCSEIERDLISFRTKEALAARKAKGLPMGRPSGVPGKSKLDKYSVEIKAMLENGSSQAFIARRYGVSPNTVNNWVRKRKINIPKK